MGLTKTSGQCIVFFVAVIPTQEVATSGHHSQPMVWSRHANSLGSI